MPVLGGEPASPAVPTPRLAAGIPAPHSVRYPAAPARLPPRPPGAGRAAPPAQHSTAQHRTALTGTAEEPPLAPPGQRVPVGAGLATSPGEAPPLPRFRFPSQAGPQGCTCARPSLTHFQRGGPGERRVWRPRLPHAFLAPALPAAAAMGLTRQYLRYEPAAVFGLVASPRAGVAFVALRGERARYVAVPACEHVFVWDTRKGEKVGPGVQCWGRSVAGQGWSAACGAFRAPEAKRFVVLGSVWREATPPQPPLLLDRVGTA